MKYNNLSIDEIREEIYNDFIHKYWCHLSHEEIVDLVEEELMNYQN